MVPLDEAMKARRSISMLLVLTLVTTSVPIVAKSRMVNIRELLEARRITAAVVNVELVDRSVITGAIERTTPRGFFLRNGTGREISYADLRAFTDETTGERFEVQGPLQTGPVTGRHPSLKAWFWIGVAAAVFLVVVYLKAPKD